MLNRLIALALVIGIGALSGHAIPAARAGGPQSSVDPQGTVTVPALTVPLSEFLSAPARSGTAAYLNALQSQSGKVLAMSAHGLSIAEQRRMAAEFFRPALEETKRLYPIESHAETIGGVYVDVITPPEGIPDSNLHRVLINLHGGGFVMGARVIGALESIPVASLGRIKVLTVDYREGPEFKFPAASEDVTAVYRELLKTYPPQNIGIYGCSAGGFLTAEAVAWIAKQQLPRPGAVGIFCASAGGWLGGDSGHLALQLIGLPGVDPAQSKGHFSVSDVAYFSDANLDDPLVAPIRSDTVLARFPPTLVLTSTRDNALSSAVYMHTQLDRLGVDAELHVFEGLPHAFFTFEPDFPESRTATQVIVKFFEKHLGSAPPGR